MHEVELRDEVYRDGVGGISSWLHFVLYYRCVLPTADSECFFIPPRLYAAPVCCCLLPAASAHQSHLISSAPYAEEIPQDR